MLLPLWALIVALASSFHAAPRPVFTVGAARTPDVRGAVVLRRVGGHLVVEGETEPGKHGLFVIDLAASTSLIGRASLPAGARPRAYSPSGVSASGATSKPGSLRGAGGAADLAATVATLPSFRLGSIDIANVDVTVIPTFQTAGSDSIIGIIGLDLLRRAGTVTIERATLATAGRLVLGATPSGSSSTAGVTVPIRAAGELLSVAGTVDGIASDFILDTGSPITFVGTKLAERARLETTAPPPNASAPHGLDGRPLQIRNATIGSLTIGGASISGLRVKVGDVPVLAKLASQEHVGLLGLTFFERFSRLTVDFAAHTLTLLP